MAPVDVVLLGGGGSRRMGTDKASLVVAGRRLIDHLLDDLAALRASVEAAKKRRAEEAEAAKVDKPAPKSKRKAS